MIGFHLLFIIVEADESDSFVKVVVSIDSVPLSVVSVSFDELLLQLDRSKEQVTIKIDNFFMSKSSLLKSFS
jgi:hypothetical protein